MTGRALLVTVPMASGIALREYQREAVEAFHSAGQWDSRRHRQRQPNGLHGTHRLDSGAPAGWVAGCHDEITAMFGLEIPASLEEED